MKITLFLSTFEISIKIASFNHYGKGFYCFTTKEMIPEELIDAIGHSVIYSQSASNTYTIGREVKFRIE